MSVLNPPANHSQIAQDLNNDGWLTDATDFFPKEELFKNLASIEGTLRSANYTGGPLDILATHDAVTNLVYILFDTERITFEEAKQNLANSLAKILKDL